MILRKPGYYDRFSCICGECPDTCCQNWEINIDPEHVQYYAALPGPLGDRVRSFINVDAEGIPILSFPGQHCPMQTEEGLCSLQKTFGAEALCTVCNSYPRFRYEFGGTAELGLSISCPEVCRLVLEQDFILQEEVNHDLPSLNDIRADRYFAFYAGRKKAFEIALDRSLTIEFRLQKLLILSQRLEKAVKAPEKVLNAEIKLSEPKEDVKLQFQKILNVFQKMEFLREEDRALLPREFIPIQIPGIAGERLLCYYIYKYFLQAAYDGKLYWRMAFAAASLLMIFEKAASEGDASLIQIASKFSRETEHSEENLRYFSKQFTPKNSKNGV